MLNTLSYIGKELNRYDITWGVGASILLNHYGLVDKPNDIDILVDLKDIEKVDEILKSMGKKYDSEKITTYSTKYFYEYVINGFEVDVMSGLTINHSEGSYTHIFDKNSISKYTAINNVNIPLTSLEEWYYIYQLIPNREVKVKLIEEYLGNTNIIDIERLNSALNYNLPKKVKENIKLTIDKNSAV